MLGNIKEQMLYDFLKRNMEVEGSYSYTNECGITKCITFNGNDYIVDNESVLTDKELAEISVYENVDNEMIEFNSSARDILLSEVLNDSDYSDRKLLLVILFNNIFLEDENKSLTLTDKQYKEWLNTNNQQYITSKQFEVLFGLTSRQQKQLRSRLHDRLPSYQVGENTNILYDRSVVSKWLENYKK